jgi:hypothetical protein
MIKTTVQTKGEGVYGNIKQSKRVIAQSKFVFDDFLHSFEFDSDIMLLNDDEKYFYSHFYVHSTIEKLAVDKVHMQ